MIPPPCPPGTPFYALVIIGHRYDRRSGDHLGEDGIILANDECKSAVHKRRSQFLTFPVRVAVVGDSPGRSFCARADSDWWPIAPQLGIPWHEVSHVPEVGEVGLMKGLFLLRIGQKTSINIHRERRALGVEIVPMERARRIKPYYCRKMPETVGRLEEEEYLYMYFEEQYGLSRLIKYIWPVCKSNKPAFSRP